MLHVGYLDTITLAVYLVQKINMLKHNNQSTEENIHIGCRSVNLRALATNRTETQTFLFSRSKSPFFPSLPHTHIRAVPLYVVFLLLYKQLALTYSTSKLKIGGEKRPSD
jgi:hypothetical protein